jgi:hypothetical protein
VAAAAPARKPWSDLPTLLERLPDLVRFTEKRLDVMPLEDVAAEDLARLEKTLVRAGHAVRRLEDVLAIALTKVELQARIDRLPASDRDRLLAARVEPERKAAP